MTKSVLAFISNRSFFNEHIGGLRRMLRARFDRIRIIDLHRG